MKPLKFHLHWKLGLSINITIIMLLFLVVLIVYFLVEKHVLNEAISIRLERNFRFAYQYLIENHSILNPNIYKIYREEFFRSFPYIELVRSEKIAGLSSKENKTATNSILLNVFKTGLKSINFDRHSKKLEGFYPVKADYTCITCHQDVNLNKVLGVFHIKIDLSKAYQSLRQIVLIIFLIGLFGILLSSFIMYHIYMNTVHRNIEKINVDLHKIVSGDLKFAIDKKILTRKDIIGELSNSIKSLHEYLTNFTMKLFGFSLKLTKQVEKVYFSSEFSESNIKNLNLNLDNIEILTEKTMKTINDLVSKLYSLHKLIILDKKDIEDYTKSFELIKNEILEIIKSIDDLTNIEEKINTSINESRELVTNFINLVDQVKSYTYESLLIATYLKNLVASIQIEGMEEHLFDLFESDLDRYLLRIESHLMDVEKLDPIRWSDPRSISLGKWLESSEYNEFKKTIPDFDFDSFESTYYSIFPLAKDLIEAYNSENYLFIDENIKSFRAMVLILKSYLLELKSLYLEFTKKKEKLS